MSWKDIKATREQIANLYTEMGKLVEVGQKEKRSLSGEEATKFDKMEADAKALKVDMDRAERVYAGQNDNEQRKMIGRDSLDSETADSPIESAKRADKAFSGWLKGELSDEERSYIRAGVNDAGHQKRALSIGSDSALVPVNLLNKINERLKWYDGVLAAGAEVISTTTAAPLHYPYDDDTANVGEITAEAGGFATNQDPTINYLTLTGYKFDSAIVKVSVELLQDSAFNIQEYLLSKFITRIGRKRNTAFTTGTGSGTAQGFVYGGSTGVTTAGGQTTSVTIANLTDLFSSVDRAYRQEPCAWQMNDTTWGAIKKLTDSTGRPLIYSFMQSIVNGEPEQLLGSAVVVNNDMANIGAGTSPIAFGNFKRGYVIREVTGMTQIVKLDQLYAANGQVGYVLWNRADGQVTQSSAYQLLTMAAS